MSTTNNLGDQPKENYDSFPSTPPLSGNSSGDALDVLHKSPGIPIPVARDTFFGYSEEKAIQSV